MSYLLVSLFRIAAFTDGVSMLAETSTSTVLLSMVLAAVGGGITTVLTGWLAIRKHRDEQAKWRAEQTAAEKRLDIDRFDKSMALLVAENERQYDEIGELRAAAREDHLLIIKLQDDLAQAKREARTAFDSASIANSRIAELEAALEAERSRQK